MRVSVAGRGAASAASLLFKMIILSADRDCREPDVPTEEPALSDPDSKSPNSESDTEETMLRRCRSPRRRR